MNIPEICVMISRPERLDDIGDVFSVVPGNVFIESVSGLDREEVVNQLSVGKLRQILGSDPLGAVRRLYFGQETCERLIPSSEDILKAVRICAERKWGLSLVLPYVGSFGVKKIKSLIPVIFEVSETLGQVEFVVQDFAGLMIVSDLKNPNIIPVLGRLFTKMKRDPRFMMDYAPTRDRSISLKMKDALRRSGMESAAFVGLMRSLGVRRFSIEALPQGADISRVEELTADIYWPWIYVTSGRACQMSALSDPERFRHLMESPCHFECRDAQIIPAEQGAFYSVARGNTIWMEHMNIKSFGSNISRLVYTPYIPQ